MLSSRQLEGHQRHTGAKQTPGIGVTELSWSRASATNVTAPTWRPLCFPGSSLCCCLLGHGSRVGTHLETSHHAGFPRCPGRGLITAPLEAPCARRICTVPTWALGAVRLTV